MSRVWMAAAALATFAAMVPSVTPGTPVAKATPVARATRRPLPPPAPTVARVPSAGAARMGPAPSAQPIDLVLPLRADLAGLRRFALSVSSPGDPRYGDYEPIAQLARRFGASSAIRSRVIHYLRRAGARHVQDDVTGLYVHAQLTAGLAARLFDTELEQFRSADGTAYLGPTVAAAAGPTATAAAGRIPPPLQGLVTGVVGLDARPLATAAAWPSRAPEPLRAHAASQPTSARTRSGTPSGCRAGVATGGFTPNQYLTAYGYAPLRSLGLLGQGQRVALIEVDGFKYSDIRAFASCFRLPIPVLNGFGVGVRRPGLPPGGEATLDLELLDAAAPRLKSIDVYETHPTAAATLSALTAPLRSRQPPQLISVSLGLCEPAVFKAVGLAGFEAAEGALEMATASGVTLLGASGDQGSADCTQADGSPARLRAVNFPASSWWVTGVGGTNLVLDGANQIRSQVVWNDAAAQPGAAGGGGVSALFARPNYQTGTNPRRHRTVPDVAMLADVAPGYAIYCSARGDCINPSNGDPWQTVGGTSAASPLLAGGLAVVDQALAARGQRRLGLVNPLLYRLGRSAAAGSVFFDVTAIGNDVGPDIGGGRRPLGCCAAGRGYDLASGLGSVKLDAFAAQALSTQPPVVRLTLRLPRRQHPLRARRIIATVGCSGPCLAEAIATVSIAGRGTFSLASGVAGLKAAGARTLTLRLSPAQVRRVRSALAARRRVRATVRGSLLDPTVYGVLPRPGKAVHEQTPSLSLSLGA